MMVSRTLKKCTLTGPRAAPKLSPGQRGKSNNTDLNPCLTPRKRPSKLPVFWLSGVFDKSTDSRTIEVGNEI